MSKQYMKDLDKPFKSFESVDVSSTVRYNLATRPNYAPYCGDPMCRMGTPRTHWNGEQFKCSCGWISEFQPEFITAYKAFRESWVNPPPPSIF